MNPPKEYNSTLTLIIICFSVLALGLAVIFGTQVMNRQLGKQNQAYQRLNLCIFSYPPASRTSVQIQECYTLVQKETGINLVKYNGYK